MTEKRCEMDSMMMGMRSEDMQMPGMEMMDVPAMQACIDACAACEQACTVCSTQLMDCAAACMNCADMAGAMMRSMLRMQGMTPAVMMSMLDACVAICQYCMDTCLAHADHSDICRMCAQACRACMDACTAVRESMMKGAS